MNVRKTAPPSKAKTIQRGRECFLKKALDLWLIKLKKSKYNAFINTKVVDRVCDRIYNYSKRELLAEVMKFSP